MAHILVIDDSQTMVAGIKAHLQKAGFEVIIPERFVDIHRLIQEHKPMAIVLDINMPTLSGEQIGNFLRRNKFEGHIVLYSGEPEARMKAVAEKIGAKQYLSKEAPPSDLAMLLAKLTVEVV